MSQREPRGEELVRRYKDNYSIADEAPVTEEMILKHWELEKALTRELLASTPENRREVFERCYTTLYAECAWLNRYVDSRPGVAQMPPARRYAAWAGVIGTRPKRIYEIGSGRGELITFLASLGHDCTATEITRERGEKQSSTHPNLRWTLTDGVHLDAIEAPDSYDVVLSDQVVEHLHPSDLATHFQTARQILAPGGFYLFGTPHRHQGPCDVSRVFKTSRPMGMHLREYGYGELARVCRQAGFQTVQLPLFSAGLLYAIYSRLRPRDPSSLYLLQHVLGETLTSLLPVQSWRRGLWKLLCHHAGLRCGIFMLAGRADPRGTPPS